MALPAAGQALTPQQLERPTAGPGQILIRIEARAAHYTDLYRLDGEFPKLPKPVIAWHQIVGNLATAVSPAHKCGGEGKLMSVANLTRRDGTEILELGVRIPIRIQTERFEPGEAIEALVRLRRDSLTGSAILEITG